MRCKYKINYTNQHHERLFVAPNPQKLFTRHRVSNEIVRCSSLNEASATTIFLTREDVVAMQALFDAKFEDYEGEAGE